MLPVQARQSGVSRIVPFSKADKSLSTFTTHLPCSRKIASVVGNPKYNAFRYAERFVWEGTNDQPNYMGCKMVERFFQTRSNMEFDERILKVALEKDRLEVAIQMFRKMQKLPRFTLTKQLYFDILELLNKCCSKLQQDVVLDIYRFLRSTRQPIPVNTYNAVLSVLKPKGDGALALQIYQEMMSSNTSPDVNSLNLLLQKCDSDSSIVYILKEFKRANVNYNAVTYGELISKYLGEDYDQAMHWYRKMEDSGYYPEEHLYYRIIKLNLQLGHMDLAHSVFESLVKHQRPTLPTLSMMVVEHCRLDRMAEASHYFHVMRKYKIQSTPQIYQALIDGFLRQADLESAIGVYTHLYSYNSFHKIAPDTYTRMIAACTKNRDMPTAKWLFDEMNRRGVNINEYTYSVMIAGYGHARDGPGVDRMYEAIRLNANIEPDIGLYNTLLNAYNWVGDISKVLQLYDSIQAGRLIPNNVTISILLDSCGRHDALYRAQIIWNRLKQQKFPLNCNNYTSYIEALGRNGQSLKAVELIADIELTDIRPDLKMFSTLLSFLKRDGHQGAIQRVSEFLRKKHLNLHKLLKPKIERN